MSRQSHSSISKYMQCGEAYRLHYQEGLRPIRQSAALLFGTSIDKGLEATLKGEDGYAVFDQYWKKQYLNDVQTSLMRNIDIVYAESDFDKDLFRLSIQNIYGEESVIQEFIQAVEYKEEKGYENIPDPIKELANEAYWWCLKLKGKLMLDAFHRDFMPQIEEILSLQEKGELENDEGDTIVLYIDGVFKLKGYTQAVVLDWKTSTKNYDEKEAAVYSPQLSVYRHAVGDKYNTRTVGYGVFLKGVTKNKKKTCSVCRYDGSGGSHKTCPETHDEVVSNGDKEPKIKSVRCNGAWIEEINPVVKTQLIIDEIPERTEELVIQNIVDINYSIKNGIFTKNLNSCSNSFGKPCIYRGLCYHGDMSGLTKKEVAEK